MLQQKVKKKPPPRPPPPNFMKYKSKSTYNIPSEVNVNLINWSPPSSPKPQHQHSQFGGSVYSSYSSSSSSLTSSKKSLENDNTFAHTNNWISSNSFVNVKDNSNSVRPRIIRPAPLKNAGQKKEATGNHSPTMPSIPPPSPPKGDTTVVTPYGIALYDFPATQPGDLHLEVNDVVILIRRVNEEWLYGKIYDKEGIFPASFVQIEVPFQGEEQIATALYEFKPQLPSDLALKPGQKIKIIKKISDDWLYGECEGQFGQFPNTFVEY